MVNRLSAFALSAIVLPLSFASGAPRLSAQTRTALTVNADARPLSTFLGLGVEFDPYVSTPTPARWKVMMDRLTFMRPGFLRVMSGAGDYCSGLDAEGKPIYRWKTDPDDPHMRPTFAVLDFAQAHNTPVYLGEWFAPTRLGIQPGDPRWANMIADVVQFLVRERHYTVVHSYIMMNEPHGDWMWPHPSFDLWAKGIVQLRAALDIRGLQAITLAGPDADAKWAARTSQKMPTLFPSYEIHIYAKDAELASGALEQELDAAGKAILANDAQAINKPRFLGEVGLATGKIVAADQQPRVINFEYGVGMADLAIQVARAGWAGASAWDLDDAMHKNQNGGLKIWGFWDSSSEGGMALRPWFYSWSVLSRTFPAGAQILWVQGPDTPIRATAARWQSQLGTQYSVALVNDGADAASATVHLPKKTRWHVFRYFDGDRQTDAVGYPVEAVVTDPTQDQVFTFPGRGLIVVTTDPN